MSASVGTPRFPWLSSGLGSSSVWGWHRHPQDPSERCLCPLPIQNEMLNRQIQKEIWRIQDVMEGLRKNNPSRGTDTAKHRGEGGLPLTPNCAWGVPSELLLGEVKTLMILL